MKDGENGRSIGAEVTEIETETTESIVSCEFCENIDSVGEMSSGRLSVVVLFERKEVAVGEGVIGTDDFEETPRIIEESDKIEGI